MAEDVMVPEAPGLPRVASKAPLLTVLLYPPNASHPTAASRRHQQARAPLAPWVGTSGRAWPGPCRRKSPREAAPGVTGAAPPPDHRSMAIAVRMCPGTLTPARLGLLLHSPGEGGL